MRRLGICLFVLIELMLAVALSQQATPASEPTTAICTFQDGRDMSVVYSPIPKGREIPSGTVWTPGGSSMNLFTQSELTLNNSSIPVGAYSMYLLREKKNWTVIVNKNVTAGSAYDQRQDLARAPMELADLGEPEDFHVSFAHMAPQRCDLRIDYGKTGAFVEFHQK